MVVLCIWITGMAMSALAVLWLPYRVIGTRFGFLALITESFDSPLASARLVLAVPAHLKPSKSHPRPGGAPLGLGKPRRQWVHVLGAARSRFRPREATAIAAAALVRAPLGFAEGDGDQLLRLLPGDRGCDEATFAPRFEALLSRGAGYDAPRGEDTTASARRRRRRRDGHRTRSRKPASHVAQLVTQGDMAGHVVRRVDRARHVRSQPGARDSP